MIPPEPRVSIGGWAPEALRLRLARVAALTGLSLVGLASLADAWPAVQDAGGVHLCNSRPSQESDGSWTCWSGPGVYQGNLVEVGQGPYGPPMVTPPGRLPYGPYGGYGPWGPPDRGPSGYDALDPWLGSKSGR